MTDYELLSIMLTILAIITSILVAYINQKKVIASLTNLRLLFKWLFV